MGLAWDLKVRSIRKDESKELVFFTPRGLHIGPVWEGFSRGA